MENYQPTDQTPFPFTGDQEDWSTFFDFSDAAEPGLPDYGQGMLGGVARVVESPNYTGYALDMQGPPTSFESHAPELLAPSGTQWNPGQWSRGSNRGPPNEEAEESVLRHDTMAFVQLGEPTGNGQSGVQLATDYEGPLAVRSALPSSAPVFYCGMHGCQLNFPSDGLLVRHQRFHAPHHWVVSESPFRCECGQKCARLDTLCRHIQRFQSAIVDFRCHQPECTKSFMRQDHLVQHLRHLHKFSDGEVYEEFPIHRNVIRLTKPVCPFPSCPYHRDGNFKNQSNDFQEATKPFAKQSDYTKHMKNDHDWSPYPCTIPSCDKKGKNGYFRPENLQKHRDEQHPEAELFEQ